MLVGWNGLFINLYYVIIVLILHFLVENWEKSREMMEQLKTGQFEREVTLRRVITEVEPYVNDDTPAILAAGFMSLKWMSLTPMTSVELTVHDVPVTMLAQSLACLLHKGVEPTFFSTLSKVQQQSAIYMAWSVLDAHFIDMRTTFITMSQWYRGNLAYKLSSGVFNVAYANSMSTMLERSCALVLVPSRKEKRTIALSSAETLLEQLRSTNPLIALIECPDRVLQVQDPRRVLHHIMLDWQANQSSIQYST